MRRVSPTLIVSTLLPFAATLLLPGAIHAAACTNAHLTGTYSVQIGNSTALSAISALNAAADGSKPLPPPTGGFGDNPNSLGGSTPGLGRFYFTGTGTIIGQTTATSVLTNNVNVGTYTVNYDCTASIKLNSGPAFNAVVVDGGNRVLFVETDSAGAGILGTMDRAANSCATGIGTSESFGFSSTGIRAGASASASRYEVYSTVGSVTLNPDGGFSLTGWVSGGGSVQSVSARGRYTIGADCSLKLTFGANPDAATPTTLRGFLVNRQQGVFSIQPANSTTITGTLFSQ